MICPNCGAETNDSVNFCEICGSPISGVAPSPDSPANWPTQSAADPAAQSTAGQTEAMPQEPAQQPEQQGYQQPYQQAYQQPYQQTPPQQGAYGAPAPAGPQPSTAPFVLAIIALATALLGLIPVSIILAIIALVMNSSQKKRGEVSSKQTPTTVMSIVSLVLSVIMLIATIALGGLI